jgi:UDP-N-acetylmuramyl pentapeptide phosphotransferase/UDP-N-acetylglucosamine-1-phosphate transferase
VNGTITLAAGVCGWLLSAASIVPLRRVALRWGLTDRPGGHKAHARPVPYLGGIAIALGTILPPLAAAAAAGMLGAAPALDSGVIAILLAAGSIMLLGLIDDVGSLPAVTRLVVETVAATGVVLSGVQAPVTGSWADGPITVLWIVVLTNSFNLLDNMDGALAAVATVTAAVLAAAAAVQGRPALALLLSTLAFASLGYLPHNWPPARIFMGDSGSLFIGFTLACAAVLLVRGQGPDGVSAGLLLPTFVATVDTGVVFLSRIRAGRSPLMGGTDHVSHRLRRLGLGPRLVPAVLALAVCAAGALHLSTVVGWIPPLTATITGAGTVLVLIGLLQSVDVHSPAPPDTALTTVPERRR